MALRLVPKCEAFQCLEWVSRIRSGLPPVNDEYVRLAGLNPGLAVNTRRTRYLAPGSIEYRVSN